MILKMEEGLNMEMDLSFTILMKPKSIIKRLEEFIMTVVLTIVLTIGVNYLLGHWNEIVYSNRTSRKGYHTDHDAVLRDLALKGKNETLRKFNKGCYDVKDKE